ncbi:MAG TPA: hypothetical protein VFA33_22880 [Bryobacteraceae bacterium]|nr:hypothetical protein [Bryobacteraceae bacterium]
MSDCGGILLACVALPLVALVLLVAGVSYLAIQGAKVVGHAALVGVDFAVQSLASGVRTATKAVAAASETVAAGVERAAAWAGALYDSTQAAERLRATAQSLYTSSMATIPAGTAISMLAGVKPAVAPVSSASTTELLARAGAAQGVLDSELPLRLVAGQFHRPDLAVAREALDRARLEATAGRAESAQRLAAQAEALYTSIIHDAHERLREAERATVAAQVGNALADLGYEVKLARVRQNVALVGRRDQHTMAMVLRPGGKVEMDMAGFEGDSCDRETKALLDAMRRNGSVIAAQNLTRHGRFAGGPLIRRAQQGGKPLEVALAECFSGGGTQRTADAPVRRSNNLSRPTTERERLERGRALLWGHAQRILN